MKCMIELHETIAKGCHDNTIPDDKFKDKFHRWIVHVNEDMIHAPDKERSIDLLMAQIINRFASETILTPDSIGMELASAANGISTIRHVILPGAISHISVSRLSDIPVDHEIHIRTEHSKNDLKPIASTLRLDGLPEIGGLRRKEFRAEDRKDFRQIDTDAVFTIGLSVNPQYDRNQKFSPFSLSSGSLLSGMIDAMFSSSREIARERFTITHAILAAITAWKAGVSFQRTTFQGNGNIEDSIMAATAQYNHFLENGVILSDRAWTPSSFLPGPRLREALDASDPGIAAMGRTLAIDIMNIDKSIAHHTALAVIGEKHTPDIMRWMRVSHEDTPEADLSAHQKLRIQSLVRTLQIKHPPNSLDMMV